MALREIILSEIRRLTKETGQPPGRGIFTRETGISPHEWQGVLWAQWGEALTEAGFKPNSLMQRRDTQLVLHEVAEACRYFKRFPSEAQLRLYRRDHPSFPSRAGIPSHFRSKTDLASSLSRWTLGNPGYDDVAAMIPAISETADAGEAKRSPSKQEGPST